MKTGSCSWRKASQPFCPEFWLGLEIDPSSVQFPETVEAHLAYTEVARDYPKAISLTNRIGVIGRLQIVATILALHTSRELGIPNARSLMYFSWMSAKVLGPLPISIVTPETVAVVDDALDCVLPEDVATLILSDLLRLIEGVRP